MLFIRVDFPEDVLKSKESYMPGADPQAFESTSQMKLEHAKYIQEWWKAGLSVLTPIAIAVLTYFVSTSLNRQQSVIRLAEQTLQLKQTAYADIGSNLNKIFTYVADVGDYRSFKPNEIVNMKRQSDRQFFMYKAFWSSSTVAAYDAFMETAFVTYVGSGTNARINTESREKKIAYQKDGVAWDTSWTPMFSEQKDQTIFAKYDKLVSEFLRDIASSNVK